MSPSQPPSGSSPRSARFARVFGLIALGAVGGAAAFVAVDRLPRRDPTVAAAPALVTPAIVAAPVVSERERKLERILDERDAQITALVARLKSEEAIAAVARENESLKQQVRGLADDVASRERDAAAFKEQVLARDRQIAAWMDSHGRLEARVTQLEGANLRQAEEMARMAMETQTAIAALARPVAVAAPVVQPLPASPKPAIRYPDIW